MTALCVLLLIGSYFLPIIGFVLTFAVGVPLTILVVRRGLSPAIIASVAAALVISLLFGILSGVRFVLMYVPMSLAVGYMLANRRGAGKTMLVSCVAGALSVTLMLLLGAAISGFSIDNLIAQFSQSIDEMVEMYKQMGALEQMGMTEDTLRQSAQGMMVLLPAMMVIMGGILGVLHFVLSRATMRKLKLKIPRMPKFSQWYLPASAVWGLIAAWALWLLADFLHLDWLNTFAINILVIYGALLFFTGLSVLAHFMRFSEMSTGMKVVVVIFILFFFTGVCLVALFAGLLDLIFDFRKLRKNKKQTQPSS